MPGAVGQIAHLVDGQHLRRDVMPDAAPQGPVTVLGGEISEHVRGLDEARRVAGHDRLVDDVPGERGFADAVRPHQAHVGVRDRVVVHVEATESWSHRVSG